MATGKFRLASSLLLVCLACCISGGEAAPAIHPFKGLGSGVQAADFRNLDTLENGGLIFRAGHDMVSHLIMSQGGAAQYSHVGIIAREGREIVVIHAMPSEEGRVGGVRVEPLADFASRGNASKIGVYRDIRISDAVRVKAVEYARQQIGKPFDDEFSMSDDSAMYCSELVVKAYQLAGVSLEGNLQRAQIMTVPELVVLPDTLSRSNALNLIATL